MTGPEFEASMRPRGDEQDDAGTVRDGEEPGRGGREGA